MAGFHFEELEHRQIFTIRPPGEIFESLTSRVGGALDPTPTLSTTSRSTSTTSASSITSASSSTTSLTSTSSSTTPLSTSTSATSELTSSSSSTLSIPTSTETISTPLIPTLPSTGTVTRTLSSVPQSTSTETSAPPVGFLQNKPLAGAVFGAAGLVGLIAIIFVITFFVRRKQRSKLVDDAISFDPSAVGRYDEEAGLNEKRRGSYGSGAGDSGPTYAQSAYTQSNYSNPVAPGPAAGYGAYPTYASPSQLAQTYNNSGYPNSGAGYQTSTYDYAGMQRGTSSHPPNAYAS